EASGNPAGQPATFSKTEMQNSPFLSANFRNLHLQKTFHLAMDTLLGLGCILPTTRADWGLSPVRNVRRKAHIKNPVAHAPGFLFISPYLKIRLLFNF
ncbi:hypothetical protein ACTQVS_09405, partial [Anaerovoracaceae bacterium HCP3S3_H6]